MLSGRIRAAAFVAAGALFCSTSALARDIFVSTSGNDGKTGASEVEALRTIAAAANKAQPGDTVQILPGRYQEGLNPPRSGTAAAPIIFRSYGSSPAILTSTVKNGLGSAITVKGKSYIIIEGIGVDGVKLGPNAYVQHFATITDSTNIVLRRGTFNYANGWHGIKVDGKSSNVTIEDNVIDNVGTYDNGNGANSDYGDSIVLDSNSSKVLVQRNVLRHGAHNLISTKGKNHVVQDNFFDNSYRDQIGGDAGGRSGQILSTDSVFQRNYVTGSGRSSDVPYNALLKIEGVRNIARNNVFAYGHQMGIISESGGWSPTTVEGRIYNNTFYKIGSCAWCMRYYDGGRSIGDFVFVNNLVIDSRTAPSSTDYDADVHFFVKNASAGPTARSLVLSNIFQPANSKPPTITLAGFDGLVALDKLQQVYAQFFAGNQRKTAQFAKAKLAGFADFDLKAGSEAIDQGSFLTKVVGSGQSDRLKVADYRYFSNGYGLIPGDMIQLEGSTQRVRVTGVDAASSTLVLSAPVSFREGQGVALSYEGGRPDVGAREWSGNSTITPEAPRGLKIRVQ